MDQVACLNMRFLDDRKRFITQYVMNEDTRKQLIGLSTWQYNDGSSASARSVVAAMPRSVICDKDSSLQITREDSMLGAWYYPASACQMRDDTVGDRGQCNSDFAKKLDCATGPDPRGLTGGKKHGFPAVDNGSRRHSTSCCCEQCNGRVANLPTGDGFRFEGIDLEPGVYQTRFESWDQEPEYSSQHFDRLLNTPYIQTMNGERMEAHSAKRE